MPKRKVSYHISDDIVLIEKEIDAIKRIKSGELDIDLLLKWKEKLKEDLLKIKERRNWNKQFKSIDDLTDDFFVRNLGGNSWSTPTSFRQRCAAFKSILPPSNWFRRSAVDGYCSSSKIHIKCMGYFEYHSFVCSKCTLMTKHDRKTPFSLLHLSASKIIYEFEKYDAKSLDFIYDTLYPLYLEVRVGREIRGSSRRVNYIHNIIKHFMLKELDQPIIADPYFTNIKFRPVAFCTECADILERKLYVEINHTPPFFCQCKLCKFLRLGMYYTSLFEMNGHFIQCSKCQA